VFKRAYAWGFPAALLALPVAAQDSAPDAGAFQAGGWTDLGEMPDGIRLGISKARYRNGGTLTFALKTDRKSGEIASAVDVIRLDCAAGRFRIVSGTTTRRSGETIARNAPGASEAYGAGTMLGQIASRLCPPDPAKADRDLTAFMVGKWSRSKTPCESYYQLNANGTYVERLNYTGPGTPKVLTMAGKWWVKGGQLHMQKDGQPDYGGAPVVRVSTDEIRWLDRYFRCG
jgi:hypothetical protein